MALARNPCFQSDKARHAYMEGDEDMDLSDKHPQLDMLLKNIEE